MTITFTLGLWVAFLVGVGLDVGFGAPIWLTAGTCTGFGFWTREVLLRWSEVAASVPEESGS